MTGAPILTASILGGGPAAAGSSSRGGRVMNAHLHRQIEAYRNGFMDIVGSLSSLLQRTPHQRWRRADEHANLESRTMTTCPVAHRLITAAPSLEIAQFPAFAAAISRASKGLLHEARR